MIRDLPHDQPAEQACLGAAMLRGSPALRAVRSVIAPGDCYAPAHAEILAAMDRLDQRGQPIDRIMVAGELGDLLSNVGGEDYLSECCMSVATAEYVEHYARRVKDRAKLRKLILACEDIANRASSAASADEEIAAASSAINACYGSDVDVISIKSILDAARPEMERRMALIDAGKESEIDPLGVSTGLRSLDRCLTFDGLPRGTQPTVLGADTSTGKTALACHIMRKASLTGKVLYCSLEDRGEAMALRMVSAESGVNNRRVQAQRIKRDEWPAFFDAMGRIWERNVAFIEGVPRRTRDLATKVIRYVDRNKVDLVVVDYLQLFREPGRTKQEKVDEAFSELVAMSLAMPKTATLIVSQLHRRDSSTRPGLSDLYHSAAIEQGAHTVMLLWDPAKDKGIPCKALVLAKQKNGQAGIDIVLGWDDETASFCDANAIDEQRLEVAIAQAKNKPRTVYAN